VNRLGGPVFQHIGERQCFLVDIEAFAFRKHYNSVVLPVRWRDLDPRFRRGDLSVESFSHVAGSPTDA
jgi:hypothetical protein